MKKILPYLVSVASGAALGLVFDGVLESGLAWFALVPLLVFCRFCAPKKAARHGFAFAYPMWLVSIRWMMELRNNGGPVALVILGLFGLSAYCAAYTSLFAAAASFVWREAEKRLSAPRVRAVVTTLALPLLWCGAEYMRSTLLSGFAWNSLGVTQAGYLPVMQTASLGGVYAVSYLVVMLNCGVTGAGVRIWRNIRRPGSDGRRHFDLMTALTILLVVFWWGTRRANALRIAEYKAPTMQIAAVNPEFPCIFTRDDKSIDNSWRGLLEDTRMVAAFKPDLIVWPETVIPYDMRDARFEAFMSYQIAMQFGSPILAGGTEIFEHDEKEFVFNSSFLFTSNGVAEIYRKQHLVPVGEYIPLDKKFTRLQRFAPAGISCTPGFGPVLMPIETATTNAIVSPLICFEDTVAPLSRAAVRAGADILIAQSNDAWFKGSGEAWQHHRQAVFRAVENARPLVRCSNSGVMSVVSSYGASSDDTDGRFYNHPVPILRDIPRTPYTRFGDWLFGIPCAALLCAISVLLMPPPILSAFLKKPSKT